MKKLTDVKPEFKQEVNPIDEEIYWWELRFVGCCLDASFNEITSKDYKTKKARDNNWAKFAKLNGWEK